MRKSLTDHIDFSPDHAMEHAIRLDFASALDVHRRGDPAAAEVAYRALYARAAHPKIAQMLALALFQQQRLDEALTWFERARENPSTAFHLNYATALLAAGRAREAEAESRLALSKAPGHAGARLNLALALEAQQRFAAAAADFAALSDATDVATVARRGLVRCLIHGGRLEDAQRALEGLESLLDPETALVRGELALEADQRDEAEAALGVAAASDTTRGRAQLLQARLAYQRRDSSAALLLLDRAIAGRQEQRTALQQSTQLLLERGEISTCLDRLRNWIEANPRDAELHSAYLRCAQFALDFDARRLLEAHRHWAALHAAPAEFVAPRRHGDGYPLRIGWLSPAFRNGPVQTFFWTTLCALEQAGRTQNVLYNCSARYEPSSASLRAACRTWKDVAELDDEALVRCIRNDGVDVLVDLAGHAGGGRLPALSRRAAPVQVTWLDSFGTTGIDAMDFVLTDRLSTPREAEPAFAETPLYLSGVRLCYEPPVTASRPGVATRRLISLNHFAKLNDAVVALWAQILHALPDWTLCLKSRGGDDQGVVAKLHRQFQMHGIDARRIECSGYAPVSEALATYRDAAIALDPFPFSGGANTCDALWMGLPVVTWPRDSLMSRQGASMLHALDRESWIARDARDYVAIVCDLAQDRTARARWSEIAAQRVRESLGNAKAYAADLTDTLETAWRLRAAEGFSAVSHNRPATAGAEAANH